MSFSNITVAQSFTGNGVQKTFSFTITYFDNEGADTILVFLDGVLQGGGYSIVEGAADADGLCSGGDVVFVTEPADGVIIKVRRDTPKWQDASFTGTSFPASSIEAKFDRVTMQLQEADYDAHQALGVNSGSSIASPTLPIEVAHQYMKWNNGKTALEGVYAIPLYVSGETYAINTVVIYSNAIYKCTSAHTAGATLDNDKWISISGAQGIQGVTGAKGTTGDQGAKGDKGDQGLTGAAGANGAFSDKATEGEAQQGVIDTVAMSPLTTKQAIAYQVPNLAVITTIQANRTSDYALIGTINSRLQVVEASFEIARVIGRQNINNNQAVAKILDATYSEGGIGNQWILTPAGARSARVQIEIKRKTNLETRFTTVIGLMHYVDGVWYFERESTTKMVGNLDGIVFSIVTGADTVGKMYYTSDNMAGVYDVAESYISWHMYEISRLT